MTARLLDRVSVGSADRRGSPIRALEISLRASRPSASMASTSSKRARGRPGKAPQRLTELGRMMSEFVEIITAPLNILLPLNLPGLYHRGVQLGGGASGTHDVDRG